MVPRSGSIAAGAEAGGRDDRDRHHADHGDAPRRPSEQFFRHSPVCFLPDSAGNLAVPSSRMTYPPMANPYPNDYAT
jgi:hypothetical protein